VDELSALTYPRNTPFSNLGFIYSELGDFDKALAAFQNALKLDPETGNRYAPLVSGYLQLNRLDEAKATGREAERHNIDYPEVHLNLYWVNFLQHDAAGMEREAAGMMGRPGHEDQMLNYEADTAVYVGQVAKARELTQRAVEAARKVDEKEAPALYLANAAVREALLGNASLAKQQAQTALAISNSRDAEALSAIALGLADNSMQATRLADDLGRRFPQDTIVQFNYLPSIHAVILLRSKNYLKATEVLQKAAPYELGGNIQTLNFVLYPVYLRGEAYLAAKQGAAAAAEFQKIIDHPGAVRSEPIGALARLELGRALVIAGDPAKAKTAYQEFFTLWENADPDIPLLRQARTEYTMLH
jgi:tetratricopeptide (TPR) repeat protein